MRLERKYDITVITSSTNVLSFVNGGIVSEQKRLTSLILVGPTVTRPVQDPLAVSLLDNRLHILLRHSTWQHYQSYGNQSNSTIISVMLRGDPKTFEVGESVSRPIAVPKLLTTSSTILIGVKLLFSSSAEMFFSGVLIPELSPDFSRLESSILGWSLSLLTS